MHYSNYFLSKTKLLTFYWTPHTSLKVCPSVSHKHWQYNSETVNKRVVESYYLLKNRSMYDINIYLCY